MLKTEPDHPAQGLFKQDDLLKPARSGKILQQMHQLGDICVRHHFRAFMQFGNRLEKIFPMHDIYHSGVEVFQQSEGVVFGDIIVSATYQEQVDWLFVQQVFRWETDARIASSPGIGKNAKHYFALLV